MELTRPRTKIGISTTSGKVRIVQRFLEHQRADRLRIMRGIAERLAEKQRRVFITPRRTILRVPPLPPRLQAVLDAIEAAERGDLAPLRGRVKERLGEPNALAVLALRDCGDEVPLRVMDEFIRDPRAYITKESYDDAVPELVEIVTRYFHLFGEHRLALAYLHPDKPEQAAKRLEILALGHEELWRPNRIANRVRDKRPMVEEILHGSPHDLPPRPRGNHDEGLFRIGGEEEEDEDYAPNERDRLLSILQKVLYEGDLLPGFTKRDILILQAFKKRPDEEVAAELCTSPDNVRRIRSHAYAKVRDLT
jgi:hypothetical protein